MSLYQRKDTDGALISPFWYCEFSDGGKVVRKSTEIKIAKRTVKALEKSQAAARQQEALIKQEYFREKEQAAANAGAKADITFQEFSKKFLEWVEVKHAKKPNTVEYYKNRVAALLKFERIKAVLVSRIDDELIAGFIQWRSKTTVAVGRRAKKGKQSTTVDTYRPVKVATVNRDLKTLKRILNIARDWKYQTQQPKIRNLSGEEGQERVISHEEELTYLTAAPELLRDFATIGLDTGLRPASELCLLRWECVHFTPAGAARFGYVHIPRGKTKNSKRNVPMSARVKAILERRWEAAGKPQIGFVFARDDKEKSATPYSSIDSQHDRTLEKLSFKFRVYDCRHTFGTRLGESGADAYSICKLMGHSNIQISARYVHPTPERLEMACAGLDGYNQERAKAAKDKAEKEAAGNSQTLSQTA